MGCGVVERHLEMAQPTKKFHRIGPRSVTSYPWAVCSSGGCGVVVMVMLPPSEPVLANHSPDLHVHLIVDGMTQLYVLIVDSVTTIRQSARLKIKKYKIK